jgi:hypothetical protein
MKPHFHFDMENIDLYQRYKEKYDLIHTISSERPYDSHITEAYRNTRSRLPTAIIIEEADTVTLEERV